MGLQGAGVLDLGIVFSILLSGLEVLDRRLVISRFIQRERQVIVGLGRLIISLHRLLRNAFATSQCPCS